MLEKETEVKAFGDWLIKSNLIPDVLINNAGYFVPGSILHEDEGMLAKMMAVNVYAAYHLTRIVSPKMIERKSGHIFNICSIASIKSFENVGSYGISKFAMLGFSRNLREELKSYNIKVTAVCPGATFTESWKESGIDPERIMEADDIATMIFAAANLSKNTDVEDIIMRPQLGDL